MRCERVSQLGADGCERRGRYIPAEDGFKPSSGLCAKTLRLPGPAAPASQLAAAAAPEEVSRLL